MVDGLFNISICGNNVESNSFLPFFVRSYSNVESSTNIREKVIMTVMTTTHGSANITAHENVQ